MAEREGGSAWMEDLLGSISEIKGIVSLVGYFCSPIFLKMFG
jgi:hypothetical protein